MLLFRQVIIQLDLIHRTLENDFKLITQKLMSIACQYCDNRIISMLEGGYDIQALERSMIAHIRELQNYDTNS